MTELQGPLALVLVLTLIAWVLLEIRQAGQQRQEATPADRGSRTVLRFSYIAGIAGALVLTRLAPAAAWGTTIVHLAVALVLLWAGVRLRVWAFGTLGRYFTFTVQTSPEQPVITNGPYRVIRHPSYAGLLLAFTGLGVSFGNWAALLVLMACTLCGVVYRITVEERALSSALAGRYQAYAKDRKRLVPFVW